MCKRRLSARGQSVQRDGDIGRRALEISRGLDSIRTLGSSHLALGEALRYHGDYDAAVDAYHAAADIARAIANRDSQLWSLLGEAAAHLLARERTKARNVSSEVEALLNEPGYEHPLDTAHAGLLRILLGTPDDDSSADILRRYEDIRVWWPATFLNGLQTSGELREPVPL